MATKQQVTQALTILANAYPNSRIVEGAAGAPGTLDIYAEMLAHLEADDLLGAVRYCLRTQPAYLPSIATLCSAAEAIRAAREGGELSGQEAWGQVLGAVREQGIYREPCFADERIRQAVACLGWRVICLSDEQDPAVRAQFIRAYETIAAREKTGRLVAQLAAPPSGKIFALLDGVTKKLEGAK